MTFKLPPIWPVGAYPSLFLCSYISSLIFWELPCWCDNVPQSDFVLSLHQSCHQPPVQRALDSFYGVVARTLDLKSQCILAFRLFYWVEKVLKISALFLSLYFPIDIFILGKNKKYCLFIFKVSYCKIDFLQNYKF